MGHGHHKVRARLGGENPRSVTGLDIRLCDLEPRRPPSLTLSGARSRPENARQPFH